MILIPIAIVCFIIGYKQGVNDLDLKELRRLRREELLD